MRCPNVYTACNVTTADVNIEIQNGLKNFFCPNMFVIL